MEWWIPIEAWLLLARARKPLLPHSPFLWPRCQQAWSVPQQVHPDRIHNSHQTLGPFPTSLIIPLHKWTRTFNDLQTYIYNWAIWEYPIQKEIVCMAMNQMAPGIQVFETTVCLKKLDPGGRLQSETTKAERNHFGPFPAPSSPSGWHGAKEFRSLGEFAEAERRLAVTYCHVTCPNSCWSPKADQTKHSTAFL